MIFNISDIQIHLATLYLILNESSFTCNILVYLYYIYTYSNTFLNSVSNIRNFSTNANIKHGFAQKSINGEISYQNYKNIKYIYIYKNILYEQNTIILLKFKKAKYIIQTHYLLYVYTSLIFHISSSVTYIWFL